MMRRRFARDATKPVIAVSLGGTPGAAGWYTGGVTVTFACTDAGSGIAEDTVPDVTLTTEGGAQSVTSTGACTDRAGNAADAITVADINIDMTAPTATSSIASGTLGADGWYTSDVTVSTTGADDVSEPVVCTADQTQTADTTEVTLESSCTNAAGLTTAAKAITVKVDKTAPVLAPQLSTEEVDQHASVTVSPNATDAMSGVATSSCGAVDTSSVGTHTVDCTATDAAGNASTATLEYEVVAVAGTLMFGTKPPSSGGYGTFSFGGGTFPQLLSAAGCPETTSVFFWNKPDGAFAVWIPGSQVAIVNAEFLAIFNATPPLPEGSLFTARCV